MTRRKSCVHEVSEETEAKPELVEPSFPVVESISRRSILEAATP